MPLPVRMPLGGTKPEDYYKYLVYSSGGTIYYVLNLEDPISLIYTGSLGATKIAYFAAHPWYPYLCFYVNENNVLKSRSLLDGQLRASANAPGQKPCGTGYYGECYTIDDTDVIKE